MAKAPEKRTFHFKPQERCKECEADPNTACPRDVDGECLECGARLCAHHLIKHFEKVHYISIEWKGFQKETPVTKRIRELEEELEQAKLDKDGAEADLLEANRRIAELGG
jgi:hypothetical protein